MDRQLRTVMSPLAEQPLNTLAEASFFAPMQPNW
jgi:hypothetical protein